MKLSKEQKDKLAETLSTPWGSATLICDGFRIGLQVQLAKAMTFRVVTFVNGVWKGDWCSGTSEYPEQKFLNKRTHRAVSPAIKAKMEKIMGKRALAKDPYYSKTFVAYDVSWPSGKAAISHLCRVCESVEIAPPSAAAPVTPDLDAAAA